jgi:hypothetical protein
VVGVRRCRLSTICGAPLDGAYLRIAAARRMVERGSGTSWLAASGGSVLFVVATGILLPLLSRRAYGPALALVASAGLFAVGVLALSDRLPARVDGEVLSLPAPRPLVLWSGAGRQVVRVLLVAPVALTSAIAPFERLSGPAPNAVRWLASVTAASTTLVWLAGADRYGASVAVTLAVCMTTLAAAAVARSEGRWRVTLIALGVGSIVGLALVDRDRARRRLAATNEMRPIARRESLAVASSTLALLRQRQRDVRRAVKWGPAVLGARTGPRYRAVAPAPVFRPGSPPSGSR